MKVPDIQIEAHHQKIVYSSKSIDFQLENKKILSNWLEKVIIDTGRSLHVLEFIFMTDDELLELNKTYLEHDYYTDIITFPYQYDPVFAELYISIDRIKENARCENQSFLNELHRVMVHGILHLCGFNDRTENEKKEIRLKEDEALILLSKIKTNAEW